MKKLEPADPSPSGDRYCSNCNQSKNSVGGYWKHFENGTKRRWLCSACAKRRI